MRVALAAATAAPLLALGPLPSAKATTQTQVITGLDQTDGDFAPAPIRAVPFNSALGSLDSVTAEFIGTYTPSFALQITAPPPATETYTSTFETYPEFDVAGRQNIALGSQTIPYAGVEDTPGIPTSLDLTVSYADVAAFESSAPTPEFLLEYGIRTTTDLPFPNPGNGSASDTTSFTGSVILTYTYGTPVPEPAGLPVLAAGVQGMLWLRARSKRRPSAT
jgi:hypothetical protein